MAKIKLSEKKLQELKDVCKSFNNEKGELINVLHKAQSLFGYLPAELQEVIAKELNVSVAHVYGVVTFYSFFTMTPKGELPFQSVLVRHAMCVVQKRCWRNSNVC